MATEVCKDKLGPAAWWKGWEAALAGAWELSQEERARYRQTILGFEAFCAQHGGAVSVEQAREFVRAEQLARGAPPAQVQGWKEALNWWFRRGRPARRPLVLTGVPPLSRQDQGECDWERRLIGRLRTLHYAWRTEQTYRGWAWKFVRFLGARPLSAVSGAEVGEFLTHLAVAERVAASTQNQALNALVFFLRESEKKELGDFGDFERARRRLRVPVVLSRRECEQLFAAMEGTARLMAELMYGSGLRLMELLRLRVKDVDWERRQLVVREGNVMSKPGLGVRSPLDG